MAVWATCPCAPLSVYHSVPSVGVPLGALCRYTTRWRCERPARVPLCRCTTRCPLSVYHSVPSVAILLGGGVSDLPVCPSVGVPLGGGVSDLPVCPSDAILLGGGVGDLPVCPSVGVPLGALCRCTTRWRCERPARVPL